MSGRGGGNSGGGNNKTNGSAATSAAAAAAAASASKDLSAYEMVARWGVTKYDDHDPEDDEPDHPVAGPYVDPLLHTRNHKRKVKRLPKVDWQKKEADMVHKQHLRELAQRNHNPNPAASGGAAPPGGAAPGGIVTTTVSSGGAARRYRRPRIRCPENWVYCVAGCVCVTEPSSGSDDSDDDSKYDSKTGHKKTVTWLVLDVRICIYLYTLGIHTPPRSNNTIHLD